MLIKILIVIAALAIVFAIVVSLQTPSFSLSRSTVIQAPAAVVFEQVNDFHRWEAWSPWAKLDPAMKTSYEGSPAGKGAVYTWKGDSKVDEGRMEINESRPGELVGIDLQFIEPFRADNIATFTFQPSGDGTNVTWTMTGRKNFMMKAVHMFMNMDKMVGGDFEKGLAQMKTTAEAAAKAPKP